MEVRETKIRVTTISGSDFFDMRSKVKELRSKGWETLFPLDGEHPRYRAVLYWPTRKSLTKFD